MDLLDRLESKKLKGLLLLFAFLLLVLCIYLIADALWGVSELLFSTVATSGTGGAAAHQAAQGAADWKQASVGQYGTPLAAPSPSPPPAVALVPPTSVSAASPGSAVSVGPPRS